MEPFTLSAEFQPAIAPAICESLGWKPGLKLRLLAYAGRIVLVPVRPIREMRGFLEGMDMEIHREDGGGA